MERPIYYENVLRRAHGVAEAARANIKPIALDCLIAAACVALMVGAAFGEVTSGQMAINAAYPKLSDGRSAADAIMGLSYTLAFYALLGHVLICSITGRLGIGLKWLMAVLGVMALLTMLLGMGLFSFSATFVTTGGDDAGSGLFAGMTGPALGLVGGSLFTVSFVAACHLAEKLVARLRIIFSALAERERLAHLDRAISAVSVCIGRKEAECCVVAELDTPGALVEKVAAKVGRIVGNVTSQAQEAVTTRRSHDGIDLGDKDEAPFRDVPLPILERVLADLKQYTIQHFRTLLCGEKQPCIS